MRVFQKLLAEVFPDQPKMLSAGEMAEGAERAAAEGPNAAGVLNAVQQTGAPGAPESPVGGSRPDPTLSPPDGPDDVPATYAAGEEPAPFVPRQPAGMKPGAKPLSLEEMQDALTTPAEPEFRTRARNVNLDYVGVENADDIGRLLDAQAERMNYGDEGPQTFADIRKAIDGRQQSIVEELLKDNPGALTPEQMTAADELLVTYASEQKRLVEKITNGIGIDDEDYVNLSQITNASIALQSYVQGKRRVAARTLNAMKMTRSTVASFDPQQLQRALDGADIRQQATIIAKMHEADASITDINTALAQPPGIIGSLVAWRTASLLSGAKTWALNMGNNLFWGGMRGVAVKGLAGGLSGLRVAAGRGSDTDRIYMAEVGAEIKGAAWGIAEALDNSLSMWFNGTFRNGGQYVSKFGDQKVELMDETPRYLGSAIARAIPGVPEAAGKPVDLAQQALNSMTFGVLGATDEFFQTLHIRATANTLALREGLSQGLEGDDLARHIEKVLTDPDAPLYARAKHEAEVRTFTNQDDLLPVMKWLSDTGQTVRNNAPIMGIWLPFVRTPISIVDRNLKYTPIAALQKDYRERLMSGTADGDMARAELTAGVAVMTAAMYMSMAGLMTGNGPSRREDVRGDAKRALEASGWQPLSVVVGDKYVQLTRGMDPITYGPMLIASTIEAARYSKTKYEALDYLGTGSLLAASQIADGSYLMGLQSLFDLMLGRTTVDTLVRDFGTSMIPRSYQSTAVEIYRHMYGIEGIPFVPKSDTLTDAVRNQFNRSLFGEAATLRYWDGTAVVPGGGDAMALWNTLMPIRASYNYDTKGREYDMATHALIIGRVPVTRADPNITVDRDSGYSIELTSLEGGMVLYDELQKLVGEERRKAVEAITNEPEFAERVDAGELKVGSELAVELHDALTEGMAVGRERFIEMMEDQTLPGFEDLPYETQTIFQPDERDALLDALDDGTLLPEEEELLRERGVRDLPSRESIDTPQAPKFGSPTFVPEIG